MSNWQKQGKDKSGLEFKIIKGMARMHPMVASLHNI
jgi:hypothetical protein